MILCFLKKDHTSVLTFTGEIELPFPFKAIKEKFTIMNNDIKFEFTITKDCEFMNCERCHQEW